MRSFSGSAVVAGLGALACLLIPALGGCGCSPSMGKFNVEVALDPSLSERAGGPPQITVDLVGLNDTQVAAWTGKSMTQYWTPNDRLRVEAKSYQHEMSFGPGNASPKTLSKSDPIWEVWKSRQAMHLFVLADLPGAAGDQPGDADGRRKMLPLDKCRWEKDTIRFVVQSSQIECLTPPKPPEQK